MRGLKRGENKEPNNKDDRISESRSGRWIAHLPEDHPLAKQHTSLLQATNSITWTSAHSRQLAVWNGLRILLVHGYDSVHHIKDDDLKLLSVRWSKGTDALDAARSEPKLSGRSGLWG
jgi:hypothetical protein